MTNTDSRLRLAKDPARLQAVEALLERYPALSDDEIRQAADYLRTADSLDVGLLSSNKAAWAGSEQLHADRPDLFRMRTKGWLAIAAIVVGTVLLLGLFVVIAPK